MPPTTTVNALQAKTKAAKGKIFIDVGFWGGLIPENISAAQELCEEGIMGLYCSLSAQPEPFKQDFPAMNKVDLESAIGRLEEGTTITVSTVIIYEKVKYEKSDI